MEFQMNAQMLLRAQKSILDSNPSGTTPDDLEKMTQEMYHISAGKKDAT
jgi:hypothetical protein